MFSALATVGVALPDSALAAQGTMTPITVSSQGNNYGYWEYLPPSYDGVTPMPVMVFLSGIGEVGTGMLNRECPYPTGGPSFNGTADMCNNLRHGPPLLIWQSINTGNESRWPDAERPFVMLAPQNPIVNNAYDLNALENFFNYVQATYAVDERRMYLTGMSQGGRSALLYLQYDPERFAATIMTAGAVNFSQLQNPCPMTRSAFWAFHGENDGTGSEALFQPQAVVDFVDAYNGCPEPAPTGRMTMYLNAGHNVWTRTFRPEDGMNDPVDAAYDPYDINMYDWLLLHDKPQIEAEPDFGTTLADGDFMMSAVAVDDDAFDVQWIQTGGPSASIFDDTTSDAIVFPSADGVYTFEVTVVDADGQWDVDDLVVTVGDPGPGGGGPDPDPDPDPGTGGGPAIPGTIIYQQDFDGPDGESWPSPWQVGNSSLMSADLDGDQGRLRSSAGTLGRMALPGFAETEVDIAFTVTFEDFLNQGVAVACRQSLTSVGQGYAVYLEGGFQQTIGIWRELYGGHTALQQSVVSGLGIGDDTPYRVRFQCFTEGNQTHLRARLWPEGDPEPTTWRVDMLDGTPSLQGYAGGFSVDLVNYSGTNRARIDDLVITEVGEGGVVIPPEPVSYDEVVYTESFDGGDSASWPAPWYEGNASILLADVFDGQGQLSGATQEVSRMIMPGFDESNVEVEFSVVFDDYESQGVGFYVRQNGGVLDQTVTPGQGYNVYVEGGFQHNFGFWREVDGVESPVIEQSIEDRAYASGVPYRVRFQCFTQDGQTRLRGRIWAESEAEPDTWLLDVFDDTPQLQGLSGSFAVDMYNYVGLGTVAVDDLQVTRLLPL